MASVTHQALLMVSPGAAAAVPRGWQWPLSGVAPSLARDRFLQARADASSYRNSWLSPPAAAVKIVLFGWHQELSTVPARNAAKLPRLTYANDWLSPANTIKHITTLEVAAVAGVATFTNADIGTAAVDRLVVLALAGFRGSINARTLSSVTIGGNAATINVQVGNNSGLTAPCLAIAQLGVAAGTTATIIATYSGAITTATATIYTITGLSSVTPVTGSNAVASGDPSTTVNVTGPDGIAVALWAGSSGTIAQATFTGVAIEDYDAEIGGLTNSQVAAGHSYGLATETPRTFSATSTMTAETIVVASWSKV